MGEISILGWTIPLRQGGKTFHTGSIPHALIYSYSKCSIKAGSLRELTRWLELPGNRPIGTFLPVYDLLHTHTGCRALKRSQIFKLSPQSGCRLESGPDKGNKERSVTPTAASSSHLHPLFNVPMIRRGGRKNPRNNKSKTSRERTRLINILPLFSDGQVPQSSFWPSSSHYRLFFFSPAPPNFS